MVIVGARNLQRTFGHRRVLDDVTLAIDEGERAGLVGRNGSGKSTLARILAGVDVADAGELTVRRGARIGYLEQEPQLDPEQTAEQIVLAALGQWNEARARHEACSRRLAAPEPNDDLDGLLCEQAEAAETLERLGGWEMQHESSAILGHLGIGDPSRLVGTLSGGEQRRVALARLLISRPDLAILDEPTNHLDAPTIEWLEEFLIEKFTGALLLVTHDRYLLDRVVDRIHDLEHGRVATHVGGYADYLEAKAERLAHAERTEANRRNFLRRELQWLRRQPKARGTKQKARTERALAAQATTAPTAPKTATLAATAIRSGRTILELSRLRIDLGGRTLIDGLDLALSLGDRVGIVGRNGAGKTSLLRAILGTLAPSAGTVRVGHNTRIAYLDQTRAGLDPDQTVWTNVLDDREGVDLGQHHLDGRSYLERFLFGGIAQRQLVGTLSGGERARVALARMLAEPSNLLVLDEPTNDLDLDTMAALEELLGEYAGSCLVVTHDRYFLDRIATAILAFEADGSVVRYEGDYSTYLRLRRPPGQAESPPRAEPEPRRSAPKPTPARPALGHAERRELERLEQEISAIETAIDDRERALADPHTYEAGPDRARALAAALAEDRATLATKLSRWEALESKRG